MAAGPPVVDRATHCSAGEGYTAPLQVISGSSTGHLALEPGKNELQATFRRLAPRCVRSQLAESSKALAEVR